MSSRCGTLNSTPAPVLFAALRRQRRPGGVVAAPCRAPRHWPPRRRASARHARRSAAPSRDIASPGAAPSSRSSSRGERLAVERGGVGFLDLLDRAALHEQPLHRIERRQLVDARACSARTSAAMPNSCAEEILDMRRQIDEQVGFALLPSPSGSRRAAISRSCSAASPSARCATKARSRRDQPVAVVKDRRKQARVRGRDRSYRLVRGTDAGKPAGNSPRQGCASRTICRMG